MAGFARRDLLPLALLIAIVVADLLLGEGHSASTLVVIAPLFASSLVGPAVTAGYGLLSLITWGVLGLVDDQFSTASGRSAQLVRFAGIVVGALIAIVASEARGRREARLHRVERVAEVAQRAILAQLPERIGALRLAARYESSAQDATVGGDFYAALDTPFGVRLLIGDVRGNGLDAVRLAAAVLGAFRERAEEEADPVDLLERLHAAVRRAALDGDFVTAVVVQMSDDGQLTLVNAGHLPPVLLHGTAARLLMPDSVRPPLGLPGRAEAVHTIMEVDDRLLLYTDGATEARRPGDRAFRPDEAIIRDAAGAKTPEETVERVFAGLMQWAAGHLTDDVAVLSVQYRPVLAPARTRGVPAAAKRDRA
jgi:serine phosphatase RsbU (regulator of sigma subunit)